MPPSNSGNYFPEMQIIWGTRKAVIGREIISGALFSLECVVWMFLALGLSDQARENGEPPARQVPPPPRNNKIMP